MYPTAKIEKNAFENKIQNNFKITYFASTF